MTTIEVFGAAMCRSTGVWGPPMSRFAAAT
jgi:hypothetical protein